MFSKTCWLVGVFWIYFIDIGNASSQIDTSPNLVRDSSTALIQVKERTMQYMLGGSGDGRYRQTAVRLNDDWMKTVLEKDFQPLVWEDSLALTMNLRLNSLASDLRRMAIVYQSKGSSYEKSPELKQRIERGLENILEYFNPESPRPGNWYQWLISLPNNLGATGLLMESSLPRDLSDRLRTSLRHQLSSRMVLTGTNAAWEARNHIYLALLDGDTDRLQRAAEYVFRSARFGIKQGVREDYCYLYHGQLPYAGAYGVGFVQTIAEFIYVFEGSPFAISPRHFEMVAGLLLEHTRWFLVDGQIDLQVRGRTFERRDNWNQVLEAFLVMAQIEDDRKEELSDTALALLTDRPEVSLNLTSAGFADQLPSRTAALPTGFRYWPTGEIGVYKQPSYHVGFRQYSSRVQDYEYLNREDGGQGEEGWNLAYGFTNVLREDGTGSWYSDEPELMWPEIDMEHLPGTTSRIGGNPVNPRFERDSTKLTMSTTGFSLNFGTSPFAGGAGWEDAGVAGFILEPAFGEFVAQKSLHFFPQGFWALGSGIRSTAGSANMTNKPLHTTILQWASQKAEPVLVLADEKVSLVGETEISLEGVNWLWLDEDDVGVVFHTPTDVTVRLQGKIITMWINHGDQPVDDRYAYALLPRASLDETKDFANSPSFMPVRYDKKVHAVKAKGGESAGLVFFEPDTSLGIHSESSAIVYHKKGKLGGIVTVQDPLHRKETIKLSMEGIGGNITKIDPQIDIVHSGLGPSDIQIATDQGRIYRFGYGEFGEGVYGQPRNELDIASYKDFQVSATSDSEKTILTVRLPEEAIQEAYHLSIHFSKSQRLYDFTEADVLDRPAPNIVRYQWIRKPATGPGVFSEYLKQTDGHFHVYLVTQSIEAVESFEVPVFAKEASAE